MYAAGSMPPMEKPLLLPCDHAWAAVRRPWLRFRKDTAARMTALLIDDEGSARRRLARMLRVHPDVDILGEAHDGLEGLKLIETTQPDVVFLDIQMPELDGFGVIRAITQTGTMPLIVFATSYDDHALAAFESNAVAYLLKPIEPERLSTTLERVRRLLTSAVERDTEERRVQTALTTSPRMQRIVCRKGSRLLLMDPTDVLWFYIDAGIVRAKAVSETYWVNYQLTQLEAGLDSALFFRARRELLVNLGRVKSIRPCERSTFVLTMMDSAETELSVSERHAKDLRQRLPGL